MTDEQKAGVMKAALKMEIEILRSTPRVHGTLALENAVGSLTNESFVRLYNIIKLAE